MYSVVTVEDGKKTSKFFERIEEAEEYLYDSYRASLKLACCKKSVVSTASLNRTGLDTVAIAIIDKWGDCKPKRIHLSWWIEVVKEK